MRFVLLFLSFFLAKSCDKELNQEMKKATIEYEAVSRGYYLNIVVHDENLSIIRKRGELAKNYQLTKRDWNELANLYKFVKPEEISNYKPPTEKRFYDGAAIGLLKIVYEGKSYETQGFDHGTPPAEIEKLVNKIVSFATPSGE